MAKYAFGLDISDRSIEALELKESRGRLSVEAYGRLRIEAGIINDGRILQPEALVGALQTVIAAARPHPIKHSDVVLSIPESKTFIHVFQLPSVISYENIGQSVQYEAEGTIPVSFDKVYHDYYVLEKGPERQDVLYVAGYKEVIDGYREVVQRADLNPIAVEPESLALARALVPQDSRDCVLILDAGARTTTVTIYDHHGIRFSATVPVGGAVFTDAIVHALPTSADRALELLKTVGFLSAAARSESERISGALQEPMSNITQKCKRAIRYYEDRHQRPVKRIVLCGGASLTPGFRDMVQKDFEINVDYGDPLASLQLENKKALGMQHPMLFATVVGLARRVIEGKDDRAHINTVAKVHEQQPLSKSKEHIPAVPKTSTSKPKKSSRISWAGLTGDRKRLIIMGVIFGVLIAVFLVVLLMSSGGDEPLIKMYDTDYAPSYQSE